MRRPSSDILERYFENLCSPEEAKRVLEWLATPEGQTYYAHRLDEKIQSYAQNSDFHVGSQNDTYLLNKIYQKIGREEKTDSKKPLLRYWVAAAISMLLMSSLLLLLLQPNTVEVETAFGETREVELGDGSIVFLNANSTLSYFPDQPREIWLEGEGFFEVQHTRDDAPFKVHTADLVVSVLGTKFNVNTRRKKTDVVLSTGKVRLELPENKKEKSMLMEPGDKVSYSLEEDKIEKKVVNPEFYSSWRKGTVVFDHTPLREVFQLMEDTYGISIEIQDQTLLNKEMNAQDVIRDLEVMMTLVEKTFDINLIKEDNKIYLE
ncbi:transmembrane sensor [Catalinimonas alkaloidigena]|uniref:FecR family protein n=1 Tax=Catalinimonas alkaloidigena TaxID=1075417 RepID=UPI00240606F1|nr:FecR family protein [Catalinimonas alkaloidigena]MDF9796574.1 transmembrane sensor [Catalinimonas alkaloidigena]